MEEVVVNRENNENSLAEGVVDPSILRSSHLIEGVVAMCSNNNDHVSEVDLEAALAHQS